MAYLEEFKKYCILYLIHKYNNNYNNNNNNNNNIPDIKFVEITKKFNQLIESRIYL